MSNFIEVNSTYRNRNLWPIPGQFEIPIGPNYNDNASNSVDPVSLAEPIVKWTKGYLATSFEFIDAKIGSGTPIDSTMSPNVIVLRMPSDSGFYFYPQQTTDYLVGLILGFSFIIKLFVATFYFTMYLRFLFALIKWIIS